MKILVYGTTVCGDCRRSKQYLDEHGVAYDFKNIAEDEAAFNEVQRINNGIDTIPTIVFPNGKVLLEPSNEELARALEENKDSILVHKI